MNPDFAKFLEDVWAMRWPALAGLLVLLIAYLFNAPYNGPTAQIANPAMAPVSAWGADIDRLLADGTELPERACWQMPESAWHVPDCRGPGVDCWCSLMPMHNGRYGHVDGHSGSLDLFLCQPDKKGSGFD